MHLQRVSARMIGSFSFGELVLRNSRLTVRDSQAEDSFGGLVSRGSILVSDGSLLQIFNASALGINSYGGIMALGSLRIESGSEVHVERATAASAAGLWCKDVVVAGRSTLYISEVLAFGKTAALVSGAAGHSMDPCFELLNFPSPPPPPPPPQNAGAFLRGLRLMNSSSVRIQNARSFGTSGALCVDGTVSIADGSELWLRNTSSADTAGGLLADAVKVSNRARISISYATANGNAGGITCMSLRIAEQSLVEITHARAGGQGGGIQTRAAEISGGSVIRVSNSHAASSGGGIFVKEGLTLTGSSEIHIANSSSGKFGGGLSVGSLEIRDSSLLSIAGTNAGQGGGFDSSSLWVQNSQIHIRHSKATRIGGGFCSHDTLIAGSLLQISNCAAAQDGGGFSATSMQVVENSTVQIDETSAGKGGGGFAANHVEVHGAKLQLSGTHAGGDGGGFNAQSGLHVSGTSQLRITQATADASGGGFVVLGDIHVDASEIVVEHAVATKLGGCFMAEGSFLTYAARIVLVGCEAGKDGGGFKALEGVQVRNTSKIRISEARAAQDGGALWVGQGGVEVSNSSMQVSGYASRHGGGFFSKGAVHLVRSLLHVTGGCAGVGCGFFAGSLLAETTKLSVSGPEEADTRVAEGSGGFLRGPLRLERSELVLQRLQQGANALRAQCLAISEESLLSLEAATEMGVSLQNADCACPATLQAIGNITGMGMSDALLSAEACANETIEITGFHLQTRTAAVAKTSSHTVIHNVTVDFLGALNGEAPILLAPSFDAKELRATCSQCPHGLTFGVLEHGLSTLSTPRLHCGHAATLVQGFTERCDCKAHQVHDQQFSDQVQVSQTRSYCVDCPRHHEDHEDECRKCPMHKARRDQDTQRI